MHQMEVPSLTGGFMHGQAAISATVDFGVEFIWGPQVFVEVTGTGTSGTASGGAFPAELLVSVYTPGGDLVVAPKVLGPYGVAPATYTTGELTGDLDGGSVGGGLGSVFEIVIETNDIYSGILTAAMVDITNVTVSALDNAPTCGGDIGCDGFVGIADLNIVLGNWNLNVTPGDSLNGDLTGDGYVGIEDLNMVLGNWNAGTPPGDVGDICPDVLGGCDGFIGIEELNIVLGSWNMDVPPGDPQADHSGDGYIGIADLNWVLSNWNTGTHPATATTVVPEPGTLALLGVFALLPFGRRR
ncbi:MAG: hypothetical protein R3C45_14645 [Phycisphaerales bacterium]